MGNKIASLQSREAALFTHLTNSTLFDLFSRFQFAFRQIPPTIAENQQQATLRIRRNTTTCLNKPLRSTELGENLFDIVEITARRLLF